MGTLWGLVAGLGVFMVWWSFWAPEPRERSGRGWDARMADRLVQAGAGAVTPAALIAASVGVGLVVALLIAGLSGSIVVGLGFGVIASRGPFALVGARARRRAAEARRLWPDVVDSLASGVRAGLTLPEAVSQVGTRGPEPLREPFVLFAEDYRASGRFQECLDLLKARLADPVADRIVETLRLTREVGGTDLGTTLRTLGEFLRADARVRGEIEARQSWTVNAARLAVAAPWIVLAMLAFRGGSLAAYNSTAGVTVMVLGGAATVLAYRVMVRAGRLTTDERVLR
ncbi:type II secretion system F family protein [Demequina sp. NBRC 110057]|uniref:type II secretion system F family protein n=1 Tax=Demequina sp. NBRC 110057 TaxID=1570346 RepID=UPI000A07534C|nr:type II secretion system F family protein [Demequina sp. NBRC 110057]